MNTAIIANFTNTMDIGLWIEQDNMIAMFLSLDFLYSSGNTDFDMSLLAESMPAFSWSSPF